MRMRPDQPCAVKRKRKHSRKTLEDTETTTSPMASRKCQEQVSPEESGDDGLTSAKRPKCANDDEATTGPPALGLPDCQEQDEAEGETASAWPEITVVLSETDSQCEDLQQPPKGSGTKQSQRLSAVNDENRCGSIFWEAEYWKFKELHDGYRKEKDQELTTLRESQCYSEIRIEGNEWINFRDRKKDYAVERGYTPLGHDVKRGYCDITREVKSLCHDLPRPDFSSDDLPSKDCASILLDAHDDPVHWLITGECDRPWLAQILRENYCPVGGPPYSFMVAERLITKYVLRCILEPMLVGLDKEVENLLLRVQANMESRMVPSMAWKWMGEILRSYTLLPKYDQDRNDYLRGHAKYLRAFADRFFPIPENSRNIGRKAFLEDSRDTILENILEPAATWAEELSFAGPKYEADWEYCEQTTELFYRDLKTHEACDLLGGTLLREEFPEFRPEDKIADVLLFVRPPLFQVGLTGKRLITGKAKAYVKPVSAYNPYTSYGSYTIQEPPSISGNSMVSWLKSQKAQEVDPQVDS